MDRHVSVSSQRSQFLIWSLAALLHLLLQVRDTIANVPRAVRHQVQHHDTEQPFKRPS
jgi:hypothetical protein